MTAPAEPGRPLLGALLLVVGVGAVVGLAFWLLDLYLGDMPSWWSGALAASALTGIAMLRGWRDQRRQR